MNFRTAEACSILVAACLLLPGCSDQPAGLPVTEPEGSADTPAAEPHSQPQPESMSQTDLISATSAVDAEVVLAGGLATAKDSNRRLLVHLGAPW